jgi:hypothetical protein
MAACAVARQNSMAMKAAERRIPVGSKQDATFGAPVARLTREVSSTDMFIKRLVY